MQEGLLELATAQGRQIVSGVCAIPGRSTPSLFSSTRGYSPKLAFKPPADMLAIFLTGIPAGIVPGFSTFTGNTLADLLRLNLVCRPRRAPSIFGVLGGDLA